MTESGERAGSLGERLRAARKQAGLSHDALAERIGVRSGRRTIIRWEKDEHTPHPAYRDALARELNLPADFFPPPTVDDLFAASYLGRILQRLEEDPEALDEIRPELRELSGALAALAARLRQVADSPADEQQAT